MHNSKMLNTAVPILIFFLLFQSYFSTFPVSAVSKIFGLYDELFTIAIGLLSVLVLLKSKTKRCDYRELKLLILLQSIGLIGHLVYHLQPNKVILGDLLSTSKFVLVFWGTLILFRHLSLEVILQRSASLAKVLTIVLFFSSFSTLIGFPRSFLSLELRMGRHPFQFVFFHPAMLAMVSMILLGILVLTSDSLQRNRLYIYLILMPLCLTLRSKSFGIVLLFLAGYWYLKSGIKLKKSALFLIVAVTLMGIMLLIQTTGSFEKYYGEDSDSARQIMTEDSVELAKEAFPIGMGLGTFGTHSARVNYSPIYLMNGYRSIYGLGYVHESFLTDTFWPIILGQYGVLGLLSFLGIIVSLATRGLQLMKVNRGYALAYLVLLGHLLISSTSASSFFNSMSLGYALVMAFAVKLGADEINKQSKEQNIK
ncbi:hypothetical protein [Enterococcus sp. ZJ1668]|uniref:O-antigen ligase family protein n=1 Tax=Enterococcus sp. ZJ1668 TaxID=2709402 RepID=UPI0013ECD567|nr:hypothetical protein [Enterococcus sp. ZJ1668]